MGNNTQNAELSRSDDNVMLPAVFDSVEEVVRLLKLDRRHKWEEWNGEVTYPFWYSSTCSGCDGVGCRECGYKGNSRKVVPVPALMPDGSIVKVVTKNDH